MNEKLYRYIRSGQYIRFYKSKEWKTVRDMAVKRDRYECVHCRRQGKHGEAENVHHIQTIQARPDLALTLNNLVTLCIPCHNKVHDRNLENRKVINISEKW